MKKIVVLCTMLLSLYPLNAALTDPVLIQILGINDFHGALLPPTGSVGQIDGVPAGGAEFLATHMKARRASYEHTITVSAGDLFGASPLLSALFKEQPSVEAMNLMGLDLNAVGNHEFDKGFHELKRLQQGDCEIREDCIESGQFSGANFRFLAANVIVNETQRTLFPAYEIREFGPVKVAFVGVVVQGTDKLVVAESVEGLTFLDEADAVNALVPELVSQGVQTIIVLIHEGGTATGGYNECPGISGPIVVIATRMDDHVGVILSGHTHQAYNCKIGNKLVTSGASNGRLLTEILVELQPHDGALLSARAENLIVTRDVTKDADQSRLIATYLELAAPVANRVVGTLTESLSKVANSVGESVLGKIIADAQLDATSSEDLGNAEIALVNPGGIRTDLTYFSSNAGEGDGNVTYGEAFAVQPFNNVLVTMTLSGQQIVDVLEQQFAGCGFTKTRILQISRSITYTYHADAKPCHRVVTDSIRINGEQLKLKQLYRVTVNSFIANGGDYFSALEQGMDRVSHVSDVEALTGYLTRNSPVLPIHEPRIMQVP